MALKKMGMDVSFRDMPALVRSPGGMAAFRSLDIYWTDSTNVVHGQLNQGLVGRLRNYIQVTPEWESESEDERSVASN